MSAATPPRTAEAPPGVASPGHRRLLSPLPVGSLTLRNRVVMGAMHTRIETLDRPVERLAAFYGARAAGGVGLIVTGGVSPTPEGRMDDEAAVLATRAAIDEQGHRAVTEAVHSEGATIALQVLHAGRYAKVAGRVAPSARAPRDQRSAPPRALDTAEVWDLVDRYTVTARLAREAGYDGVEVMGSEGYLVNQFTCSRTNDRSDEFGGDREGRLRFPVEVVRAIREAVGEDFLVAYRISALDLVPGGLPAAEVVDLARRVERAGADLISTGIGWHESEVPTVAASVPRAAWRFAARRIKQAVSVPVVASNRINTPDDAESLLAEGDADLVSMSRPLLADPDFVRRTREGRVDEICPCIACNQACLDAVLVGRPASCMVNPRAARELDFALPAPRVRKRVAVVGAGPAGLACAVNAADRGHEVTLLEQGQVIGGQLDLARRVPGKSEFDEALRYYEARIRRLGVELRLGTRATARGLADGGYDAIVVATGIAPRVPDIVGIDHHKVVSYVDVLSGTAQVGSRVVIIGAGGIGFDVAEYLVGDPEESRSTEEFLAAWGVDPAGRTNGGLVPRERRRAVRPARHEVTLMKRSAGRFGATLGKSTGWVLRARLARAGVREVGGVTYDRIDDAGVHYTIDGEQRLKEADTVVVCAGQVSRRELHDELVELGLRPTVVGGARVAAELDAVAAIDEATRLAARL